MIGLRNAAGKGQIYNKNSTTETVGKHKRPKKNDETKRDRTEDDRHGHAPRKEGKRGANKFLNFMCLRPWIARFQSLWFVLYHSWYAGALQPRLPLIFFYFLYLNFPKRIKKIWIWGLDERTNSTSNLQAVSKQFVSLHSFVHWWFASVYVPDEVSTPFGYENIHSFVLNSLSLSLKEVIDRPVLSFRIY